MLIAARAQDKGEYETCWRKQRIGSYGVLAGLIAVELLAWRVGKAVVVHVMEGLTVDYLQGLGEKGLMEPCS